MTIHIGQIIYRGIIGRLVRFTCYSYETKLLFLVERFRLGVLYLQRFESSRENRADIHIEACLHFWIGGCETGGAWQSRIAGLDDTGENSRDWCSGLAIHPPAESLLQRYRR